ncbi:hypothetical protein Q3G72_017491 [Acer saccharum]|nr:hypothetical protein Q3G72_017491 [Acer saccharum]
MAWGFGGVSSSFWFADHLTFEGLAGMVFCGFYGVPRGFFYVSMPISEVVVFLFGFLGSPYCKFFKWADSNEEILFQLQEFNNELLNKEKELQKILDDVEMTKNELRKRVDDVEKREMVVSTREMMLLEKETELRHGRTLPWVYFTILFVIACYLIVF